MKFVKLLNFLIYPIFLIKKKMQLTLCVFFFSIRRTNQYLKTLKKLCIYSGNNRLTNRNNFDLFSRTIYPPSIPSETLMHLLIENRASIARLGFSVLPEAFGCNSSGSTCNFARSPRICWRLSIKRDLNAM